MNIRQFRKPKYLIPAILVIALAGWLAAKLLAPPPAPAYLTATATKGDIQDTVLASGTVKAYQQVSVGAQASGQIKSLKVHLGEQVKKGQLVAEIDSLPQANALRTAQYSLENLRAQLSAKQATLKQAELSLARQQQMRSGDASSQADLESAQATLDSTRADIQSLQAQIDAGRISVDNARLNLDYTHINSPIDGQVVAIVAQEGQTVNANQSTPTIIKVARMDTVTIKAQISEADVVRVKVGQPVYFSILGDPDHRYNSTLRAIEPAPDSILQDDTSTTTTSTSSASTSTAIYYNGLLDVPNGDGKLRISMTAQVNIVLSQAHDAVIIPSTALGDKLPDGRYTVHVLDAQGHAQARAVKTGINTNAQVQVIAGIEAGDKVVIGNGNAPLDTAASQHRGPPPMM